MRSAFVLVISCLAMAILSPAQSITQPPFQPADETTSVNDRAPERPIMTVRTDVHHDVSRPLRDLMRTAPTPPREEREAEPLRRLPLPRGLRPILEDPIRQHSTVPSTALIGLNFDGLGQGQYGFDPNYAPPDTDGAVGGFQYVQWVNASFAVFDKATGKMLGPVTSGSRPWWGFGGGCEQNNDGDIIVLYDKLAQRWIMSQFSVSTQPYLQCVAVSTTPDALGTWYRYAFQYPDINDYPKMGVWPDAYYETFNMFDGDQFLGANACAYDRTAMLNGQAATQVCFQQGPSVGSLLPADVDGSTPPPPGSPNYLLTFGTNSLNLFQFHVDFSNPGSSTFTGPTTINVAAFNPLCGGDTCVPQLGTRNQLDSLGDRLMFRLAYRNFGSHESLVVNHSVAANGGGGIRWYEIQNPGGTPVVAQQGTYAPDSSYRWMGSMAMDSAGDIAVGYSKSSSSLHPSIAFAGRIPDDPPGTLQNETTIVDGSGSQTETLHRWGDYSAMTVDPVDDCTFWYTQQYLKFDGIFNWNTRIVNFKFPNCISPTYTLTVSKTGTGTGTITSGDGRIDCGQVCSAAYVANSRVTLTATPSLSSDFTGWTGCDSVSDNTCTVTMYRARAATANFTYYPFLETLSVDFSGDGTVTSTDGFINCPGTCEHSYLRHTRVTLNATPEQGWTFAGWGGEKCKGKDACTLAVDGRSFVFAGFTNNAGNLTTLYTFCSQPNCADGTQPEAGLVQGRDGNFYGTTYKYGSYGSYSGGTVFRITPTGSLTILYSFCTQGGYCPDGAQPKAALIQGDGDNFYGTTESGGNGYNPGAIFKVTSSGLLTSLHRFADGEGAYPEAPLEQGGDGNFYGTTRSGGTRSQGTVFKITPGGALTTLYSFCPQGACTDGNFPLAGLVQATDGNFYGTTGSGGATNHGTVFKITPGGTLTTLYSFRGDADGAQPFAGLVQANDGNLYGTTTEGGNFNQSWCPFGCGTLFKITLGGSLTSLYKFCNLPACADGSDPEVVLVQAKDGNLYGTTHGGGTGISTAGTIFTVTLQGTLNTLYSFCSQPNCSDGIDASALVQGADGNFYGTTSGGGQGGSGTVFKFQANVTFSPLTVAVGGQGTVTTTDGFINCPGTCSHSYITNAPVTLTANAANGWALLNWSGCDSTQDNRCSVTMSDARNVSATFAPTYQLSAAKSGSGTITSSDGSINCGPTCSHPYVGGTQVTLTATPDSAWAFIRWAGCDSTQGDICYVTVNNARSVTATFTPTYKLSVSKTGTGVVTSADGSIDCGFACAHTYVTGSYVVLTASPAQGWVFTGWTGCDRADANVCSVTMNSTRNVSATFVLTYPLTASKSGNGLISSGDGHIYCGSACTSRYVEGAAVNLHAVPGPGYSFASWSGCDRVTQDACSVTMSAAKNVSATFTQVNIPLASIVLTPATVRGGDISTATITLAQPAPAGGFGVAISSTRSQFVHPPALVLVPAGQKSFNFAVRTSPLRENTDATITAAANMSYAYATLKVNRAYSSRLGVAKSGEGLISSGDGGIYCGDNCSSDFVNGTRVHLTASPAMGYTFTSWSGCDSVQSNVCTVLISHPRDVSATFTQVHIGITSLLLSPPSVKGGTISIATLILAQPAPAGGFAVGITSDHPESVLPPSRVVVPAGKTTFSFSIRTSPVRTKKVATVTATANASHASNTLTVNTGYGASQNGVGVPVGSAVSGGAEAESRSEDSAARSEQGPVKVAPGSGSSGAEGAGVGVSKSQRSAPENGVQPGSANDRQAKPE